MIFSFNIATFIRVVGTSLIITPGSSLNKGANHKVGQTWEPLIFHASVSGIDGQSKKSSYHGTYYRLSIFGATASLMVKRKIFNTNLVSAHFVIIFKIFRKLTLAK